jgi:signal transduction histidine kinase
VALLMDSKYVTLRVKDDGKGIPTEILEAFEQNQAQGGVGLLSMKERVREQSGELKIGSHREGTEIIVKIPYSIPTSSDSSTTTANSA